MFYDLLGSLWQFCNFDSRRSSTYGPYGMILAYTGVYKYKVLTHTMLVTQRVPSCTYPKTTVDAVLVSCVDSCCVVYSYVCDMYGWVVYDGLCPANSVICVSPRSAPRINNIEYF